jgi:PilZ domain
MATEVTMPNQVYPQTRRWPRFKIDVPIRLIAPKDNKVLIVQGRGNDLNEGGMAVFGGLELRLDETVAIEFTPPYSGQPIRVRGRVCHRNGYNYGVEFLLESAEDVENVGRIKLALGAISSHMK